MLVFCLSEGMALCRTPLLLEGLYNITPASFLQLDQMPIADSCGRWIKCSLCTVTWEAMGKKTQNRLIHNLHGHRQRVELRVNLTFNC